MQTAPNLSEVRQEKAEIVRAGVALPQLGQS